MFIAALFTIAKDMETIKKNEILPFVTTQKDLDGIMLSVVSQTDKYCITYMWNLKSRTSEYKKKKETDSQRIN